jgi:ABC-2 type transport system permease protein
MTTTDRAAAPAGSIYDLGYRHYEGERHGRAYAVLSLYLESLRGIFGFGRSASAKAAPFILLGLYSLFAIVQLAFSSLLAQAIQQGEQVELMAYHNYFSQFWIFAVFFCVAQAPELVCRDQRHNVLPLYFSRAMHRSDYALAKLGALTTALFVFLVLPMIALFIGDVLMQKDTLAAIGDEWPKALPVIPASLLIAAGMAAVSLAISSFSPRRAYSAIALGAYYLVAESVLAIIYEVGRHAGWEWSDKLMLATPLTSLMGATSWFFGRALDTDYGFPATLGSDAYVVSSLAGLAVFTAILLFRYRRMAA